MRPERRHKITVKSQSQIRFSALLGLFIVVGCSSLPEPKFKSYAFPAGTVFVEDKPTRRFKVLGPVRVRVNFSSMNAEREESELCRNFYNKGAGDLLKRARRERKADAVINVRSVVYYMDGKSKKFTSPECADDGSEGQILMEGKAIRYLPDPKAETKG